MIRYKVEAGNGADEKEHKGDVKDIQLSVIGYELDAEYEANEEEEEGDDEDIRFKYEDGKNKNILMDFG